MSLALHTYAGLGLEFLNWTVGQIVQLYDLES